MTQKEFEKFYNNYKPGTYTNIIKVKTIGEYKKVTAAVVRFVNYYNIKTIKEKLNGFTQGAKRDYEIQIIPHVLKLNTNTQNLLLCVYITNHHKFYSKYYFNDEEITSDEYYLKSGDKKRNDQKSVVYNFKLCELMQAGKIASVNA